MAKILYPVGTEIQVRDFVTNDPDNSLSDVAPGKRVVLDYKKGDEYPYVVSRANSRERSPSTFSVSEIKKYRGTTSKDDDKAVPVTPPAPAGVTREDLQNAVDGAVRQILEAIANSQTHLCADAAEVKEIVLRQEADRIIEKANQPVGVDA